MKKEPAYDIEKEYQLDKYEKNEYTTLMIREFNKYGKKLGKIASYEDMMANGKPLNQEMQLLLSKKDSIKNHLAALKTALDLYARSTSAAAVQPKPTAAPTGTVDPKVELREALNNFCTKSAMRLSHFFAVAGAMRLKDNISPETFQSLTPNQQAGIMKIYQEIAQIKENEDISLADEAKKTNQVLHKLFTESPELIVNEEGKKLSFVEISGLINKIFDNPSISEQKMKAGNKDMGSKMQPAKEPIVQQQAPVPRQVETVVPPKQEPVAVQQVREKEVDVKKSWAEEEEPEEEEPKVPEVNPEAYYVQESKPAEEEFSYVPTEEEEKQQKAAGRRGRGRGRGRGYGRRRGGDEFRGERRGRRGGPNTRGQPQ